MFQTDLVADSNDLFTHKYTIAVMPTKQYLYLFVRLFRLVCRYVRVRVNACVRVVFSQKTCMLCYTYTYNIFALKLRR